jgi:HlyD family secretion protein
MKIIQYRFFTLIVSVLITYSCNKGDKKADAYGNFEATEIMVSAEGSGTLNEFKVEEGMHLDSGAVAGYIDTVQLALKIEQLKAQRTSVASRNSNVVAQMDVLYSQKKNLLTDKARIDKMFKDGAATRKQVDDINGQIDITTRQIKSVETQNNSVASDIKSIDKQISQVKDQIKNSFIVNPASGTVESKYAEKGEVVVYGKNLYKLAKLDEIYLRAYVSGSQLTQIKLGQQVNIAVDQNEKTNQIVPGTISWISSTAEFTPKIIQTKEERVNLVYAFKVRVKNDGTLKIGMPGEVFFH